MEMAEMTKGEITEGTIQSSLEGLLRAEIDVVERVRESQKRMFKSVKEKDWVLLIKESSVINELSEEFASLEKELSGLLVLSSGSESKSIYSVTASFPQEQRQALNGLCRELKRLLVLSRAEARVFSEFISSEMSSLSALLEHIVPARRCRVYTRRGSLYSGASEGILLDRVF